MIITVPVRYDMSFENNKIFLLINISNRLRKQMVIIIEPTTVWAVDGLILNCFCVGFISQHKMRQLKEGR